MVNTKHTFPSGRFSVRLNCVRFTSLSPSPRIEFTCVMMLCQCEKLKSAYWAASNLCSQLFTYLIKGFELLIQWNARSNLDFATPLFNCGIAIGREARKQRLVWVCVTGDPVYTMPLTYSSFNWLMSSHNLSTYSSSSSRCRFRDCAASFGMMIESLLSLIKSILKSIIESINVRSFDFEASICGIASASFIRKSGHTSYYIHKGWRH